MLKAHLKVPKPHPAASTLRPSCPLAKWAFPGRYALCLTTAAGPALPEPSGASAMRDSASVVHKRLSTPVKGGSMLKQNAVKLELPSKLPT